MENQEEKQESQEINLEDAIKKTKENMTGLKRFCDDLYGLLDSEEKDDAARRHLVYFCNAINEMVRVMLVYNNQLSGGKK